MKRIRIALSILLAVWLVTGCTSKDLGVLAETGALLAGKSEQEAASYGAAASKFGEALLPIELEQEKAIGGGVAVKAFEQFGPYYNDPEMTRYITLVGKACARVSDRPDVDYYFAILDNDTPNAFAGPGGYIFITIGSLKNCHDEAQLAGILAHEIGHVCARHALKTLQRAKLLEGVASAGSLADPKNAEQYAGIVGVLDDALFQKGLDQKFEYEADKLGTDYAAAAGYNPWGLRQFVSQIEALHLGGATGGWFQTHPPIRERIKRLDVHLNEQYTELRSFPRAADRYRRNVTDRLAASGR